MRLVLMALLMASYTIVASAQCALSSASSAKLGMLSDLVESYQDRIMQRYGERVRFELVPTTDCRRISANSGHRQDGSFSISISPGAVDYFSADALVLVGCHELGHILGEVTPLEAGVTSRFDPRDSLEGEADYFAGSCARDSLNAPERVLLAGMEVLRFLHGQNYVFNLRKASKRVYRRLNGIDPEYPNPSCRLLSIQRGAENGARPSCWYHPRENR